MIVDKVVISLYNSVQSIMWAVKWLYEWLCIV